MCVRQTGKQGKRAMRGNLLILPLLSSPLLAFPRANREIHCTLCTYSVFFMLHAGIVKWEKWESEDMEADFMREISLPRSCFQDLAASKLGERCTPRYETHTHTHGTRAERNIILSPEQV